MNTNAVGRSWDEIEQELFTPEEIAASNLRVARIGEILKARRGECPHGEDIKI